MAFFYIMLPNFSTVHPFRLFNDAKTSNGQLINGIAFLTEIMQHGNGVIWRMELSSMGGKMRCFPIEGLVHWRWGCSDELG